METFPSRLVPNLVEQSIPRQPHTNLDRYDLRSLSNLGLDLTLKLIFVRHPIKDVSIDCYQSSLNDLTSPTKLEQVGFNSAYKWYTDTLISGIAPITIAASHQMRTRSKWFEAAQTWRIISFTCDTGQKLKQRIDFNIVLKPLFYAKN